MRNSLGLMLLALLALFAFAAPSVEAGDTDPLFVNVTTEEPHRAKMALVFARRQQQLGHPLTVFLNDKGVSLAAKSKAEGFKEHQGLIAEMIKGGGTVLICAMCMKHYGVSESDLVEGVRIGNPDITGAALFMDNGKTLSW